MALYTDGTIEATQEEVEAALAAIVAAPEKQARRDENVAEVQAFIDTHDTSKEGETEIFPLSAAGFVASADALDEMWVAVTFPTDAGLPAFYAAAAAEIVQTHGGKYVTAPYVVRQSKGKWAGHLARIATAL